MTTANAHTGSSFREGGRCRAAACHGSTCGREAAAKGSTAFVTDNNATVTQGFLYAPFGEITTEYAPMWQNGVLPNYTFNAKELDEETGMYYFETRYMAPPTFISRDPHFERYFWTTPYGYCNNNPLKYVDPTGMDGYETSEGDYVWVKNQTKASFVSEKGITYTRITGNKQDWNEATTIREANIKGLVALGFDREQAEKDVRLYDGNDPLFTKESKLNNAENYIGSWEGGRKNSGGAPASESPEINNTGYSLKFYPTKNGGNNSLGIVKTNGLAHIIEGGMEGLERLISPKNADKDPIYDMHYNNARGLLKGLKDLKINISTPPTIYSNYHRSGGMKLP